jgi:hypothetical protein
MIVACPSCHQRYRHEFDDGAAVTPAHCSGCDERFPLRRPKATYRVFAETLATAAVTDEPPIAPAPAGPEKAATPVAEEAFELEMPVGEEIPVETVVQPEEPQSAPAPPRVTATQSLVESLAAVAPTAGGAWIAYYFAGLLGRDPIAGAALGGALGLLLGWACLLWITRRG